MAQAKLMDGPVAGQVLELPKLTDMLKVRVDSGSMYGDLIPIGNTYHYEHKGDGEYYFVEEAFQRMHYPAFVVEDTAARWGKKDDD